MNIMDKFIEHLDQANALEYHEQEKKLLTLPNSRALTTSIRATAQVFEDRNRLPC